MVTKPDVVSHVDVPPAARVVRVPCIDRDSLPKRPGTAVPEPGSDPDRMAAGASTDVRKLNIYADKLEGAMAGCFSDGGSGGDR